MKNLLSIFILGVITLFFSCTQNELTHNQKAQKTVETYLDNLLKDEPISNYNIDSLIIKDITEKQELEHEAFRYRDLSISSLEKAKDLGKEYQNKQELQSLVKSVDYSKDLKELKQEYETIKAKVEQYSKLAQSLAKKSLEADSVEVLYYDIVARGTITSLENVQKNAIFPFHISKEYKILKEPTELRKEQLNR